MKNEDRIKRLRYRSWHRGWKETDLILGSFADENLGKMDAATIDIYEQLLDENDADIWDWLVGKLPPKNHDYNIIIKELANFGSRLSQRTDPDPRKLGMFKGKIQIPEDFDEPIPDECLISDYIKNK